MERLGTEVRWLRLDSTFMYRSVTLSYVPGATIIGEENCALCVICFGRLAELRVPMPFGAERRKGGPFVLSEHGAQGSQPQKDCVSATFAPQMADTRRTTQRESYAPVPRTVVQEISGPCWISRICLRASQLSSPTQCSPHQ